jgi:hypothetical protein
MEQHTEGHFRVCVSPVTTISFFRFTSKMSSSPPKPTIPMKTLVHMLSTEFPTQSLTMNTAFQRYTANSFSFEARSHLIQQLSDLVGMEKVKQACIVWIHAHITVDEILYYMQDATYHRTHTCIFRKVKSYELFDKQICLLHSTLLA